MISFPHLLFFLFRTRNDSLFNHLVFVALVYQANTSHHHDADQEVVQKSTVVSNDWWTLLEAVISTGQKVDQKDDCIHSKSDLNNS